MSNLGPNAINTTYPGLLQVDGGVSDILKPVTDGLGNPTGLSLSSTGVSITGVVSANAQNIVGGTAGAVLYQAGVGSTGFVVPGTSGQFLQSNGTNAPTWTTFNAGSIGALPLSGGTLTGPLSLSNNTISSVGNPINAYDAANKSYVDSKASGLNVKASCVVATTVNITLSGTQTIDGVAVTAGQRVLVKNQSTQSQNGIYVVAASSWSRSSDAATWADLIGATVFITSGSTQAASTWTCNATAGGTIGVTAVVFVQFAASQSYTASSGITLTGNNFTLTSPVPQSLGGTGSTSIGTGIPYSDGTSLTPATGGQIASSIGTATVVNSTNSTNSTYANNLTGGAVGDLLYQSASGVTSKLNISSPGFILTSNGTGPEWGLVAPYASRLQNGAAGSIPYQTGSSTTSFLVGGSDGQVLTYNATTNAPYWNNPTGGGGGRVGNYVAAGYNSQGFTGGTGGVLVGGGYSSQPNGMFLSMDGAANWLVHQVSKDQNPTESILYSSSVQGYATSVSGTNVINQNWGSYFDQAVSSGLLVGQLYTITSVGSTNFVSVGASSNSVGVSFYANTNAGTASGTGRITTLVGNNFYFLNKIFKVLNVNSSTQLTVTELDNSSVSFTGYYTEAFNYFYTTGTGVCSTSWNGSYTTITFVSGDPFIPVVGSNFFAAVNNTVITSNISFVNTYTYTTTYNLGNNSNVPFLWRTNINNQLTSMRVQAIQGAYEENVNILSLASEANGEGRCYTFESGGSWLYINSNTSFSIGAGVKTFATGATAGTIFATNQTVRVYSAVLAQYNTIYMDGTITSVGANSITVNVTSTSGSGTHSDWIIIVKDMTQARPIFIGAGEYGPGQKKYQVGVFPPSLTTGSPGYVSLGGINNKESLRCYAPLTSTPYQSWLVARGDSGASPTLTVEGSASDVFLNLSAKGAGGIRFGSQQANYVTAYSSSALTPGFAAEGSGTNVDIVMFPKGSGALNLYTPSNSQYVVKTTGGATDVGILFQTKGAGFVEFDNNISLGYYTPTTDVPISGYIQIRYPGGGYIKIPTIG